MTVFYGARDLVDLESPANENRRGVRPSLLDRARLCQRENAAKLMVGLTLAFAAAEAVFAILQMGVGR